MTSPGNPTWVLETEVFADRHEGLRRAAEAAGHDVITWDDDWWSSGAWPRLSDKQVVFHGSLGNADRVRSSLPWKPGAFCNTEAFRCSNWYPRFSEAVLNRRHAFTTVQRLCDDPAGHFESLGCANSAFVRPDSALKPFSGRILKRDDVSPDRLDHGFYFDDLQLPIVLAPPQDVLQEWRLVIVDGTAITGSAYDAEGRSGVDPKIPTEVQRYAESAAQGADLGDRVYVMDICRIDDGLRVLELNPFSGADLYVCDRRKIVDAVGEIVGRSGQRHAWSERRGSPT